ncbi:hypothetical protein V502_00307 [Pseudogymnoascus sp. VKM F-4520 (FW-2644)]|nr:hypothetical protein V502_00307 [Pseudogymnoascus sp. VKM F-4520 (FW-2644)]
MLLKFGLVAALITSVFGVDVDQPSLIGNPAIFGGGTYPRAIKLSDGNLLGVYTAFSGGNNIITTTQSTDQGSTWRNHGTVTSGLPTGRVICAFRNHSKTGKSYTFYRITICYSDDNGATWEFLSEPASGATNGIWEPFLRLSTSNNIQLYYSYENASNDQDSLLRVSTDGGVTWTSPATISGADVQARDGMLGVTTAPGGSSSDLIAIFESLDTVTTHLFTVMAVSSSDDGASWENRRTVYTPTGSLNNARAPQIINVGGTLVASFMTDEDTSAHNWTTGADVKVATSTDGINWGSKVTVFGVQTNWAGMLAVDDTRFLVLGDNGGANYYYYYYYIYFRPAGSR